MSTANVLQDVCPPYLFYILTAGRPPLSDYEEACESPCHKIADDQSRELSTFDGRRWQADITGACFQKYA